MLDPHAKSGEEEVEMVLVELSVMEQRYQAVLAVVHDGWKAVEAADADFLDLARQAASEIPNAEFISLEERDYYRAHTDQDDLVIEEVLRTLRRHA